MRRGSKRATLLLAALSISTLAACNAIVGIDSPQAFDQDGSMMIMLPDGAIVPMGEGGVPIHPDAGDATMDSSMPPDDAPPPEDHYVADTYVVPPSGKPGMDITAGGTFGKSSKYQLVAAIGESPGGNTVGKSSKFTLQAGVVAVTQPQ